MYKNSKKEAKNKKKQKLTGTIEDYPLVEVKWHDATGDAGWHDINRQCYLNLLDLYH